MLMWEGQIIKGLYQVSLPKLVEEKRRKLLGNQVFRMTAGNMIMNNYGEPVIEGLYRTKQEAVDAIYYYFEEMEYPFHISNWPLDMESWYANYAAESFEAQSETFASETCECGELEADDGEIYECNCCDEIFCIDCIENGDISACTIRTGDNPIADHPRIEETETGYMGPQGAICGECMSAIEYELDELPPIHEVIEEEQGTANFSGESKELFEYSVGDRFVSRFDKPMNTWCPGGFEHIEGRCVKITNKTQVLGILWYNLGLIGAVGLVTIYAMTRN